MKNVTIALDDEVHRKARIRAAELGTSLSALVKAYLEGLAEPGGPEVSGVRDMHTSFSAEPAALAPHLPGRKGPEGQPYFVDGQWVWTKDGKPRKPGAMRGKLWVSDDFDEWPEGFIDAMYGDDTEAANNWWKPVAKPPKRPKPR